MLGLGLQPLWSRFEETFGEDPYLAAQMGGNIIEGIQAVVEDGVSYRWVFKAWLSLIGS